ncbi:chromate resistance protein ChrB domain-containing protein [Mycolicibacterium septicum]|uniref:chromate resistance protein ChrB domain-containing protein n=1 Tax=Mycolicibacterium septicum TaxID=98668 RepID=UPI00235F364F|nr:chromate resistance protein ChrB domain-containing protein [Mycolicibacterium septicum]
MKWVTRKHVHLDRVASPWLITRFIDTQAKFVFIDPNEPWPEEATPFALPGAALSGHDHEGTTFEKILRAYNLEDPVLSDMADIIRAAVRHVLEEDTSQTPVRILNEGIALAMISEGLMLQRDDDLAIVEASMELYDSLFAALWARRREPTTGRDVLWQRMKSLRARWEQERPLL